ncbi:MAG: TM2 domain-containing protein [Spirochaetaceae bacterium]|jgi:TM2 domain-containing membrane protein YozV|nr:TM2 domain-containing protein [Spirochaetaceae bacterium]
MEVAMYSTGIAYFLWLISGFGALGFHRFYLNKWRSGILWAFTGGLCMIGSIYDFFTLSNQVREANIRKAVTEQLYGQKNTRYVFESSFKEKDSIERTILKVAKEQKGVVSPTEVALRADVPLEEATKYLEAMVSKGFAELRVRQSGSLAYVIPDMIDPDSPLENF